MVVPVERIEALRLPIFRRTHSSIPLKHFFSLGVGVARPLPICGIGSANASIARRPYFLKITYGCRIGNVLLEAPHVLSTPYPLPPLQIPLEVSGCPSIDHSG